MTEKRKDILLRVPLDLYRDLRHYQAQEMRRHFPYPVTMQALIVKAIGDMLIHNNNNNNTNNILLPTTTYTKRKQQQQQQQQQQQEEARGEGVQDDQL